MRGGVALWPERSGELFRGWLSGSFGAALRARYTIVPLCHKCISLFHSSFVNVYHQWEKRSQQVKGLLLYASLFTHGESWSHQSLGFNVLRGVLLSKCKIISPNCVVLCAHGFIFFFFSFLFRTWIRQKLESLWVMTYAEITNTHSKLPHSLTVRPTEETAIDQ